VTAAILISVASVAIAFASLVVNFVLNHRAAVRARKPVLVFVDESVDESARWVLRNVGNGPALNVLVAQRDTEKKTWFNPVLVPPFAKDAFVSLEWIDRAADPGLAATYEDFENRCYTSTLGGETARTYDGDRLPEWKRIGKDREVKRYWELSDTPYRERWSEKPSDFGTP
jgi:hypothetical protein